jgi:uncharacterized protein YneF (UPF0154 family)
MLTILFWVCVSVLAGLAFGKFVSRNAEIDAHEEMTMTNEVNYENRSYYDL